MSREAGRSIGGLVCQARHGAEISRRGVAGARAKFEAQADPDGVLRPEERRRRGDLLYRAHMRRLAIRSAAARKR